MKTLNEINSEISDLLKTKADSIDANKARKKLKLLNEMRLYLETNPTEDFILSEIEKYKRIIDSNLKNYKDWKVNNKQDTSEPLKLKQLFLKEVGIVEYKKKIKYLKLFIHG